MYALPHKGVLTVSAKSSWAKWQRRVLGHLLYSGLPLLVLGGVVFGAYRYWERVDHAPQGAGPAPSAAPVPVTVLTLAPQDAPIRPRFLGQLEASQRVEIRARINGVLEQQAFREGETVQKGQTLFRIDPRPFQVELEITRSRLASAEAKLIRSRDELKRAEQTVSAGAGSRGDLDTARADERVATADVALARSQIEQAALNLGYTTITAPVTGPIGRAQRDVGSYVEPGSNGLLAVLQQTDPIYVRYPVSEQEILRWERLTAAGRVSAPKAGEQEIEVTLSDGRTYPHKGRINFVDVQIDPATGTMVVRGTVPNPSGTLRPGQFVHASVLGVRRVGTLAVPQKAVMQLPIGSCVYVVNAQNVVEMRPVTLGEWSGADWVVEKGLRAGERVVTDMLLQVRPGMSVAPTAAAVAAPSTPTNEGK